MEAEQVRQGGFVLWVLTLPLSPLPSLLSPFSNRKRPLSAEFLACTARTLRPSQIGP